jgi:polyhydroxyalkanoate synthesis regulator phasin
METPKFNSDEEFFAWTFEKISEAITNLTHRVAQVEEGLQKIPPPGPDMIKYKPPLSPVYQNLLELFDTIFGTLNSYEERLPSAIDWEKVYRRSLKVEQMEVELDTLRKRLNKLETKQ